MALDAVFLKDGAEVDTDIYFNEDGDIDFLKVATAMCLSFQNKNIGCALEAIDKAMKGIFPSDMGDFETMKSEKESNLKIIENYKDALEFYDTPPTTPPVNKYAMGQFSVPLWATKQGLTQLLGEDSIMGGKISSLPNTINDFDSFKKYVNITYDTIDWFNNNKPETIEFMLDLSEDDGKYDGTFENFQELWEHLYSNKNNPELDGVFDCENFNPCLDEAENFINQMALLNLNKYLKGGEMIETADIDGNLIDVYSPPKFPVSDVKNTYYWTKNKMSEDCGKKCEENMNESIHKKILIGSNNSKNREINRIKDLMKRLS